MKKNVIKKTIVLVLMAVGMFGLLADSEDFGWFMWSKIIGLLCLIASVQLCAWWHLFIDYLNKG